MVLENFNFTDFLSTLDSIGFYEVALPFLLVFTIFFAILQKISLFGKESKNINIVVALAIAFFVIRVPQVVNTINTFLPNVSLVVIVIIMVLLILGILGFTEASWGGLPFFVAILAAIAGVVWSLSGTGLFNFALPRGLRITTTDVTVLAVIAAFFLIIWLIARKKPTQRNPTIDKIVNYLGERPGGQS